MEIWLLLFGGLLRILALLARPVFKALSWGKRRHLPPIKNPLLTMTATTLARKIRNREVSSESVVRAFVDRCREVNSRINAVVEERFEEAIQDARTVDWLISSGSNSPRQLEEATPLLGVPITVKESCGLKGMSQCVGCKRRMNARAVDDGHAVGRLRRAGAIPIGVTNTPELCLSWETTNLITGTTSNPYNPCRTAGGSSGGEGAMLGSGCSVIGIGSDLAGSIRIPSMFGGVFGHKPTPGYVPTEGHYPHPDDEKLRKFLVVGPMSRYAEDLLLAMKVMSGQRGKELCLDEQVDLSKLHIFYKTDSGLPLVGVPVDERIKTVLLEAADHMNSHYKCRISKAELGELAESLQMSASLLLAIEGVPDLLNLSSSKSHKERPNLYVEIFKSMIGTSEHTLLGLLFMLAVKHNALIPKTKCSDYLIKNEALKTKINKLLGDDGVLFYPTFPIPPFYHNEFFLRCLGIMYTMVFNTLELPSTHVPLGLDSQGLPIGIQVIGGHKQDRLCIAVARALEARFGGWIPPPSKIL